MSGPYIPKPHLVEGKLYIGPPGSEVIGEVDGQPVFADHDGVGRSMYIGTFTPEEDA